MKVKPEKHNEKRYCGGESMKEKDEELEKNVKKSTEPVERGETEPEETPRVSVELPKSVQRTIDQQGKMNQLIFNTVITGKYHSVYRMFEPIKMAIREARKYVQQPHIMEAVKRMQNTLNDIGDVTKEDNELKKHSENPYFWQNVSKVSKELVILPLGLSNEVLDYLESGACDLEEVKRMIGAFDVIELEKELEEVEHQDYLFKPYLQEIIELHKTNPDNYRVSIPALFAIIEGTLGEIFKISEDGMASEIKQKMNVFWDIYGYVYANQFIGSAFAFWNQFFLANTKEVFYQLTVNSKDAGVMLNRNAVIHGKSNPDDWTLEHFETLLHLLHTTLFLRTTVDFLTKDFDSMIQDEFYDEQTVIFREFEQAIPLNKKNGKPKTFRKEDVQSLRKSLKTDLNHIFNYDEEKLEFILEKSNFHEIEERLLTLD